MIRDCLIPLVIIGAAAFMLAGTLLSHDISWYLISTGWWLDGLPVYEEILELNPPLAFYLTAPPVWLAEQFDLSPMGMFKGYVYLLILVSVLLARSALRQQTDLSDNAVILMLGLATLCVTIAPITNFGQRDHLFAIFFLPFLIMQMSTASPARKTRAMIGVWATFGVALKHYFILLPLLILAYRIVSERSVRPLFRVEFLLPAGLLVAYALASYLLHPAYFDYVIPLTLQTYGSFDAPLDRLLGGATSQIFVLAVCVIMMILNPRQSAATVIVNLVAFGAVAIYLLQSKGWPYQRIPADVFVAIAILWTAFEFSRTRHTISPAVIGIVSLALLLFPAIKAGPYRNSLYLVAEPYFSCPPGQRSFQVLGSNVSASFPLANALQAKPANRAPTLWLFPGATYQLQQTSASAEMAEYQAVLDHARQLVVQDFLRERPQVVIVDDADSKSYFNGADFDYLAFMNENNDFADKWGAYELKGRIGHFDVYSREGCEIMVGNSVPTTPDNG